MKRPLLAVDTVILTEDGAIVLIKRSKDPFKGYWALPGGFVEYGETVEEAAIREAFEETGIRIELLALVGVYSDPSRDPRGHIVSIAYLARPLEKPGGGLLSDEISEVRLFRKIPSRIAFDHSKIIRDALILAKKLSLKTPVL